MLSCAGWVCGVLGHSLLKVVGCCCVYVCMCVCVCVGAGVSVFGGIMCAVCMQKCALVFDFGHRIGCQPMTIHAKNY